MPEMAGRTGQCKVKEESGRFDVKNLSQVHLLRI